MQTASPLRQRPEMRPHRTQHVGAWAMCLSMSDVVDVYSNAMGCGSGSHADSCTMKPQAYDARNAKGTKIDPKIQSRATQQIAPSRRFHSINQRIVCLIWPVNTQP
jgi:hypothetical protein